MAKPQLSHYNQFALACLYVGAVECFSDGQMEKSILQSDKYEEHGPGKQVSTL